MALLNDNPRHELTVEEQRAGGIASGKVRQEKATMRKQLEAMLKCKDGEGKIYSDLVQLGLIANAIDKTKGGNPEAYKTIAKILGELDNTELTETKEPVLNINITTSDELKEAFYKGEENG